MSGGIQDLVGFRWGVGGVGEVGEVDGRGRGLFGGFWLWRCGVQ